MKQLIFSILDRLFGKDIEKLLRIRRQELE